MNKTELLAMDIHNHYVGGYPNGCYISPPLQRRLSSFYRYDNQPDTHNY